VSLAIDDDASDGLHRRGAAVKRAAGLLRFSEEHHHELVQARRLLRAAGAGPEERLEAARVYAEAFFSETVDHFRREEEELFPLYVRHAGRTPALERILAEHMQLHGLARALRARVAGGEVEADELRELGSLLAEHVRVEERELFEDVQRAVPAAELDALRR
jgi:hemerythrin-like domain-containing protein